MLKYKSVYNHDVINDHDNDHDNDDHINDLDCVINDFPQLEK